MHRTDVLLNRNACDLSRYVSKQLGQRLFRFTTPKQNVFPNPLVNRRTTLKILSTILSSAKKVPGAKPCWIAHNAHTLTSYEERILLSSLMNFSDRLSNRLPSKLKLPGDFYWSKNVQTKSEVYLSRMRFSQGATHLTPAIEMQHYHQDFWRINQVTEILYVALCTAGKLTPSWLQLVACAPKNPISKRSFMITTALFCFATGDKSADQHYHLIKRSIRK